MSLKRGPGRAWLLPVLLSAAALLVLVPPRAPYIYGSGLSSDKILLAQSETRWCVGQSHDQVRAGASTHVLIDAVNEGACTRRRLRDDRFAFALLIGAILVMRRRAPRLDPHQPGQVHA
jgi:hypothetical protein